MGFYFIMKSVTFRINFFQIELAPAGVLFIVRHPFRLTQSMSFASISQVKLPYPPRISSIFVALAVLLVSGRSFRVQAEENSLLHLPTRANHEGAIAKHSPEPQRFGLRYHAGA